MSLSEALFGGRTMVGDGVLVPKYLGSATWQYRDGSVSNIRISVLKCVVQQNKTTISSIQPAVVPQRPIPPS
jgi:hypothetical protein